MERSERKRCRHGVGKIFNVLRISREHILRAYWRIGNAFVGERGTFRGMDSIMRGDGNSLGDGILEIPKVNETNQLCPSSDLPGNGRCVRLLTLHVVWSRRDDNRVAIHEIIVTKTVTIIFVWPIRHCLGDSRKHSARMTVDDANKGNTSRRVKKAAQCTPVRITRLRSRGCDH